MSKENNEGDLMGKARAIELAEEFEGSEEFHLSSEDVQEVVKGLRTLHGVREAISGREREVDRIAGDIKDGYGFDRNSTHARMMEDSANDLVLLYALMEDGS